MSNETRHAEVSRSDRVRSFEPPPPGFDPATATADALSQHGLPRRPDPEREPYLAERWASAFGRPLSIVAAELASDPLPFRGREDALTSYGVDGWAGVGRAIVRPGNAGPGSGGGPLPAGSYFTPATFVSAEWEVPKVTGDPTDLDKYLSIWAGLDGFPEADVDPIDPPPGQILRGGVAAVPGASEFRWVAWAEWWTSEYGIAGATVTNFPVQSGDTVGVVVCVTQSRSATVFLANLSREHGTSVVVPAPAAAPRRFGSAGTTVEWIVEGGDPFLGRPGTNLPFSPVTFRGCVAGSPADVFNLQPDALVTNMFALEGIAQVPGPNVTRTSVTSPTTAVVDYVGAVVDA
jgi:hypothetical protein